jgi:hypothetical protein
MSQLQDRMSRLEEELQTVKTQKKGCNCIVS